MSGPVLRINLILMLMLNKRRIFKLSIFLGGLKLDEPFRNREFLKNRSVWIWDEHWTVQIWDFCGFRSRKPKCFGSNGSGSQALVGPRFFCIEIKILSIPIFWWKNWKGREAEKKKKYLQISYLKQNNIYNIFRTFNILYHNLSIHEYIYYLSIYLHI